MSGIDVRELGTGPQVELWGEFDLFCIEELKGMLSDVSTCSGPVLIDLSGITFLDLQSARELVSRSLACSRPPTFLDPSSQVTATMRALGFEGWPTIPPATVRDETQVFSGIS